MNFFKKEYSVYYKIIYSPYPDSINAHAFIKARDASHIQKKLERKHSPWTIYITKIERI